MNGENKTLFNEKMHSVNEILLQLNNQLLPTILFNFPFFILVMDTNVTSELFHQKMSISHCISQGLLKNMQLEGEHFQWLHT